MRGGSECGTPLIEEGSGDAPSMNTRSVDSSHGDSRPYAGLDVLGGIVLTPDLFEQGLFTRFNHWLEQWDAEILAAIPRALTPADVSRLYSGRISYADVPGRERNRWLTARLFELGPVLFLLLRRRRTQAGSLQETIRQAKGKSGFGEHSPESLRGMSPISDRAFSLVHSPDDVEGLLHECALFLGPHGLARLLSSERPTLRFEEVSLLIPEVGTVADLHPLAVITRLTRRALAALICDPGCGRDPETLRHSFSELGQVEESLRPHLPFEKAWPQISRVAAQIQRIVLRNDASRAPSCSWLEARRALARRELLFVVAALCRKSSLSAELAYATADVFRRNHLPISSWDQHRLHILAAFHGAGAKATTDRSDV